MKSFRPIINNINCSERVEFFSPSLFQGEEQIERENACPPYPRHPCMYPTGQHNPAKTCMLAK